MPSAKTRALALAAALLAASASAASAQPGLLEGSRLADYVRGTAGADRILLLGGDDQGLGGRGSDTVVGGAGADYVRGGRGADRLYGGRGRDILDARDGARDRLLAAGPGVDTCLVDAVDAPALRGCELVSGAPGRGAPVSRAVGAWEPGPGDTCPAWLHRSYSVIGPDGRLYPTWHPPRALNPVRGRRCEFGHEHGRNPAGSDLYPLLARRLGAQGRRNAAGVPFGVANEALDAYAAANPGYAPRHEDHVGHKVEWQNDVELQRTIGGVRTPIGVTCDFLTKLHQGSHSADALGNNVHELLYAVSCDDGTRLVATRLATIGAPNSFTRSCDKQTEIPAGTGHGYPAGAGARLIPDRACVERHLLVGGGEFSQYSLALYEDWISSNRLLTAGGRSLAYYDPHFAVFNPSRYAAAAPQGSIARVIDACWETEPGSGDRARGGYCEQARQAGAPLPWDSPASGFDGSHREVYLNQTSVTNRDGPKLWWTDPYGANARTAPFAGAICQLVSPTDNSRAFPLESQAFGAGRDYGGRGVHAPN